MQGRYQKKLLIVGFISLFLSACGGSGSGSSAQVVGTNTVNCPSGSTCAPEQVSMVEAQS